MIQQHNAHVLMWDNMAWASLARHHRHSVYCDETNSLTCLWWSRWWVYAKLGHSWWSACTSWWHLAEANSYLCCNQCIGSTPSSKSFANMHMVCFGVDEPETHYCIVSVLILSVCWCSCESTCRSTCSTPVGITSCLRLGEFVERVGLNVCAQWHACCWIPCMSSTTLLTMSTRC